jgi:hypothetical protein
LLSNANPPMRQRRQRTNFNDDTIEALDVYFAKNPYPDINERESIAKELHTSEDRIQVWFQNKRARYRKKMVKNEKLDLANNDTTCTKTAVKKTATNKKTTVAIKPNQSIQSPQSDSSVSFQASPINYNFRSNDSLHSSLNDSGYASFNQSYVSNIYDSNRPSLQNYNLNALPYSMAYSSPYAFNSPYIQLNSSYSSNYNCFSQASPIAVAQTSFTNYKSNDAPHKERAIKPFFRPYE